MHEVRPLDRDESAEIVAVADGMRATLVEVLGLARGVALYDHDWLVARVRWHLDPERCDGEVFVVTTAEGAVVGHTIVRVERDGEDTPFGLFSTTWVQPDHRRLGLASALLQAGEAWMAARGLAEVVTNTAATNAPLIRMFEGRGYGVALAVGEMVQLRRKGQG